MSNALGEMPAPGVGQRAGTQDTGPVVIVVELEIEPTELDNFKAVIKENAAAWVREEPGCLEFNVVFDKDSPTHAFLFEVYENAEAIAAHQATSRFKQHMAGAAKRIRSRKVTEMVPFVLNAKGR
ncbi:MAG TPA: putative quinol monooxygenase [Stellaceae bacterium]|jgi:quinol monooxygenase YgiN